MKNEEAEQRIKQLVFQRSQLSNNALTLWIADYASTLADPVRRAELISIANKRAADEIAIVRFIDEELVALRATNKT